ncbi:ABC transporter permease [Rhodocytophaga rosea]|uniref:Transport permease protein n=1 Tax=Rhodocytophaga rosea TaxID=2704465 RepID=A0A6C0GNR5_9BACT|nr:ABC transporter permease [Rhodocytophaga rosea]QHT69577.1 ABC transporter permease [Rhodocytophaga rosea]
MAIETSEAEKPVIHTPKEEDWTMEIKSNPGLLDINLKELWRYRDLITLIVRRDFVSAYKQTILGPVWHLAEPMVTTLTYAFIFGAIANISTDGLPRILFYLSGIMLWTYFSNCLLNTSGTFNANAGIFGKVYFPRLVMPITTTISGMIAWGLQFMLFIVLVLFYLYKGENIHINIYALLTPLLLLMIAGTGLGLGMLFSSVSNKYRDFRKLLNVSMRLLMFATPIIYPLSKVPDKYKSIILLNPMTPIVESFRYGWLGIGNFSWSNLGYSFIIMLLALVAGILAFNRVEKIAMDTI